MTSVMRWKRRRPAGALLTVTPAVGFMLAGIVVEVAPSPAAR